MKTKYFLLAGVLLITAAVPALAQQNTIRFGVTNIQPHSSAGDFSGNGPAAFTPPGSSLYVRDKTTAFFSYSREINDNWDVELALGVPPTHDVILKVNTANPALNAAFNGQKGATVQQIAPTLFANYKFLEKSSAFRPFVGVGINYTRFGQYNVTDAGNQLNCGGGAIPGCGPSSLSMSDSWGLALQAGATYKFTKEWSMTVSVATAQVKSTITTNTPTAVGNIQRNADIKFNPVALTIAAGYSF